MKVNLRFESKDPSGEMNISNVMAVMEVRNQDFKLVFVEDLSGEGKTTKSTIILGRNELRLIRDGEIKADFIFGINMVHNTSYSTIYGDIPVTLESKLFEMAVRGCEDDNMFKLKKSFMISARVTYDLIIANEPQPMDMRLTVTSWDENINV